MYGKVQSILKMKTEFYPLSPYGVANYMPIDYKKL